MLQLRKVKDQVFNRRATDRVTQAITEGVEQVRDQGSKIARQTYERSGEAAKSAYGYVMNHPKSTTAVVLGTAVAAGLWWFVQRNGGYNAVRKQVLQRVRGAAARSRSRRQSAAATEQ
jgi:ElaB/YqjD/DUF883 family membrane-anchored ribosome-binding protein